MWNSKKVSVVMPAYNEEDGVSDTVRGFRELPEVDEIIVVDNDSNDKTAILAQNSGAKVIHEKNRGYGYACIRALKEASGYYIVLVESDDSFFPKDIHKFLAFIDDFDIVKGGRINKHMIKKGADWGFFLKWGNWFVARLMQLLYHGPSMKDIGVTFRMIKRPCLNAVLPYLSRTDSAFLPDLASIALRMHYKLLEIPINYRGRKGTSKITGNKWRAFKLGITMIRVVIWNRIKSVSV